MKSDYNTKQRKLLLTFLKENEHSHITAADIKAALFDRGEKIGTATIYRHLDKMVAGGLVKKYITGSSACYQYTGDCCKNHFHLKCTVCGRLFHIDCEFLNALPPHILEHHKFTVDKTRMVMYGTCEKCKSEI